MKALSQVRKLMVGLVFVGAQWASQGAVAETVSLPDYQQQVEVYRQAIDGKQDTRDALEQLESWQSANPDEPLVKVYMGGAQCLVARDAWMPWTKLKFVNRGMDTMDAAIIELEAAVEKAQASERDLFMAYVERGMVYANLPSMFKRSDMALEDLTVARDMPQWQSLPSGFQQKIEVALAKLSGDS